MLDTLEETIRQKIEEYRTEMEYFQASGMTDRDQTNLVLRLTDAVSDALQDVDRKYVAELEEEVERLEQELKMAKGPGYEEMRNELSGARALAKHLIYRLGKEDDTIRVADGELREMEQRVKLVTEGQDGVTAVQVEEFEEG
jgi:hypothetical protein